MRADAASCRAPAGGASCVASIPNLDDACLRDAGCRQQHCGDGVVDLTAFEQCEPPGTATCDASCQFIHTCGNGVIEAGEECDGDPTCTPACTLARALCCDLGEVCIGRAAIDDFDQYFFSKNCNVTLGGETIAGTCEGVDACEPPAPPELGCRVGSCVDRAIDPLALCCQQAAGGCRDTVATTSGALGAFGCANFPPFNPGEVNRMLVGTCGTDGLCRPAH